MKKKNIRKNKSLIHRYILLFISSLLLTPLSHMSVAAFLLLKCLATVKAGKLPVWPLLAEYHMESVCFFICQVKATVKAVPLGSGDGLVELGRDNY